MWNPESGTGLRPTRRPWSDEVPANRRIGTGAPHQLPARQALALPTLRGAGELCLRAALE